MKAKLISQDSVCRQQEFVLARFPALIGRVPDAVVQLDDSWVSRRHCEIAEVDGTLVVRDLGSRHGTFVNGTQVSESPIRPGDRLTVGISTFQVSYGSSAPRPLSSILRRAVGRRVS